MLLHPPQLFLSPETSLRSLNSAHQAESSAARKVPAKASKGKGEKRKAPAQGLKDGGKVKAAKTSGTSKIAAKSKMSATGTAKAKAKAKANGMGEGYSQEDAIDIDGAEEVDSDGADGDYNTGAKAKGKKSASMSFVVIQYLNQVATVCQGVIVAETQNTDEQLSFAGDRRRQYKSSLAVLDPSDIPPPTMTKRTEKLLLLLVRPGLLLGPPGTNRHMNRPNRSNTSPRPVQPPARRRPHPPYPMPPARPPSTPLPRAADTSPPGPAPPSHR